MRRICHKQLMADELIEELIRKQLRERSQPRAHTQFVKLDITPEEAEAICRTSR
jgi:hypothetical protein